MRKNIFNLYKFWARDNLIDIFGRESIRVDSNLTHPWVKGVMWPWAVRFHGDYSPASPIFYIESKIKSEKKWPNLTTIPRKVTEKIYELKINDILVPHIRPEERLMAAQQQQLLQAANAQHMAAMVALEAMQNQAKVNIFIFFYLTFILKIYFFAQ